MFFPSKMKKIFAKTYSKSARLSYFRMERVEHAASELNALAAAIKKLCRRTRKASARVATVCQQQQKDAAAAAVSPEEAEAAAEKKRAEKKERRNLTTRA